jgi:hypothetical protein
VVETGDHLGIGLPARAAAQPVTIKAHTLPGATLATLSVVEFDPILGRDLEPSRRSIPMDSGRKGEWSAKASFKPGKVYWLRVAATMDSRSWLSRPVLLNVGNN